MRGDFGLPLEELCRVATAARMLWDSPKCTEMRKGSIHDYA